MSDSEGYSDDFDSGSDIDATMHVASPRKASTRATGQKKSSRVSYTSSMGSTTAAYATARVGSAASKQLSKVKNKLKETQLELFNVKKELKIVSDLNRRQEKELDRYTGEEADLPNALRRKDEEIRALESRTRKLKEKNREMSEKIKKLTKSERSLMDKNKALEALAKDKQLKPRAALEKALKEKEEQLRERDALVARLERIAELKNKERNRKPFKPRISINDQPNKPKKPTVNRASKATALSPKPATKDKKSPHKSPLTSASTWESHGLPPEVVSPKNSQGSAETYQGDSSVRNTTEEASHAREEEEARKRSEEEEKRKQAEIEAARKAAADEEAARKRAEQEAAAKAAAEAEKERQAEAARKAAEEAETARKRTEQDRKKKLLLAKLAAMDNSSPAEKDKEPRLQNSGGDDIVEEVVAEEVDPVQESDAGNKASPLPPWLAASQEKNGTIKDDSDPLAWLNDKDPGHDNSKIATPIGGRRVKPPSPVLNAGDNQAQQAPEAKVLPTFGGESTVLPAIGNDELNDEEAKPRLPTERTIAPQNSSGELRGLSKPPFSFAKDKASLPGIGASPAGSPRMGAGARGGRRGRGAGGAGNNGTIPGFHRPKRPKMKAKPAPHPGGSSGVSVDAIDDVDTIAI